MTARADRTVRRAPPNSREHELDLGAQRLERGLEQEVVLKAVAATAFGHQLALERLLVEFDRHAAMRIEVLEWDRA